MYVSLLFWLALILPGYVIVRRVWQDDLDSGLMGTIALSYLASLGLLSAVSIPCYIFHAPVWFFSTAYVVLVLGALLELTRRGAWRATGKLIAGGFCLELLVVVADMVMGIMVGTTTSGDAPIHLSRIRVLLEHGFQNFDPFVGAPHLFPIYHTNILHALHAACTQLTGSHHIPIWFASLPWAKLLIASSCFYLAWCVFEKRWVAWTAALFAVGWWGPVTYVGYPNKLAPLWLLPLMMGFCIQACRSTNGWRVPLKILMGSLVLGQVHGLYGAFAGVALGPLLTGLGVHRVIKRHADRWRTVACIVALGAALPFLLVSKTMVQPNEKSSQSAFTDAPAHVNPEGKSEWVTMKPRRGWGTPDWRTACLVAAAGCTLAGARRKQGVALLAIASVILVIFFLPPLLATAIAVFEQKWIVGRMGIVLDVAYIALVPTSFAYFLEPRLRLRPALIILSVAALAVGMSFPRRKETTSWQTYYTNIIAPRAVREKYLDMTKIVLDFCDRRLPRGETVLMGLDKGTVLCMVHDCHIVAPARGGNGITDLYQRRKDLAVMTHPQTPWETRRSLLRKYNITYFFPSVASTVWVPQHLKENCSEPGFRLFAIDTDR